MLAALSRADGFVSRWGESWRDRVPWGLAAWRWRRQLVKASDDYERVVGGIDVIAGLLGGVLDALSIRRDQRRAPFVNPAVTPRGGP